MVIFRILDYHRLLDLGSPDLVGTALDATYHHVSFFPCNWLGTYFDLLVGIGALESCETDGWLVFSCHL